MSWLKIGTNLSYSLEVGNPKMKLHSFLDSVGENPFPCLFHPREATYSIPGLVSPSSIFKSSSAASSNLNLSLSFCLISAFVITSPSDSDPRASLL